MLFLLFAGRVYGLLRTAEGEPAWLAATALAAATAGVATIMAVEVAVAGAAFYRGVRGLDPAVVGVLFDARHFGEMVGPLLFAVFLGCTAAVALASGVLSRRIAWSAALIAALTPLMLPLGYESSQIPVFLMAFWVLAVSLTMVRRRGTLQPRG